MRTRSIHKKKNWRKQTSIFYTMFFVFFSLLFISFIPAAKAAWQEPPQGCDPNTDPNNSACDVSAPINVSSAAQTKNGQLTVKDLVISDTLTILAGGTFAPPAGSITGTHIANNAITSAHIQNGQIQLEDVQSGIFLQATGDSTIQGSLTINSAGTRALIVNATGGTGIYASTNTSNPAMEIVSTAAASAVGTAARFSSNNTSAIVASTGGSGQSAIYTTAGNNSYALKAENTGSGKYTYLGGTNFSGEFFGNVYMNDSLQVVNNTSTNSLSVIGNANFLGTITLPNNSITSANITDGTITSSDIADNSIASTDIANGTVTSTDIADGTIATGDIANGAVTLGKTSFLTGSQVWNPNAMANNQWQTTTIAVAGANTGNGAVVATESSLVNYTAVAHVIAANVVRITLMSAPSGVTVDLPAARWYVYVIK